MAAKKKKLMLKQCRTVGEVIEQLQRLPSTMPVELFDDGVVLVPVNVGKDDEHLNIEGTEATSWQEGRDWLSCDTCPSRHRLSRET